MAGLGDLTQGWRTGTIGFALGSLLAGGVVANIARGIEDRVRASFEEDLSAHIEAYFPHPRKSHLGPHVRLSGPQNEQVNKLIDDRMKRIDEALSDIRSEIEIRRKRRTVDEPSRTLGVVVDVPKAAGG